MKVETEVTPQSIAIAMVEDPAFGGEVLGQFLAEVGRRPCVFADAARLRRCPIMTAKELRALAKAIEKSGDRPSGYSAFV